MLTNPGPIAGFAVDQDGSDLAAYRRLKITSGKLALAASTDVEIGTSAVLIKATAGLGRVAMGDVVLRNAQGIVKMIASEAIPLTSGKALVYAAANGKVAATGTILIGSIFAAATADGDEVDVLRIGESSNASAAGGTTAAAFEVDSDASTPKIALSGQSGGTGDFTTTLKPETTLSADNAIIVPEANGDTLAAIALAQTLTNKTLSTGCLDLIPAETVTPAADGGAGSQITAGVTRVDVAAVTNDADDWILLPAIAAVPIGFTINIACNAGGNFELRTPASSNTKINDVDSDGTQEYLCTDTDLIRVTKHTTTGWVAQSLTKLGAVRTAVIPD